MQTTRRNFIKVVGGGMIASALPATLGFAADMPEEAIRIWLDAPPMNIDVRRWAVAHALLAPNPHNLQPWLVDLKTPGLITLYFDQARSLPETDPYYRQLMVGCGAFTELLVQALNARGYQASVTAFPDGEFSSKPDARPVVSVKLNADATSSSDPLFSHVRRRWTHRMPFDPKKTVAPELFDQMMNVSPSSSVKVQGSIEAARVNELRNIAAQAWEIEIRTPRTWLESVKLTRVGPEQIKQHRDGISLVEVPPNGGDVMDPSSAAFKGVLAFGIGQAQTAMGWLWSFTPDNTRATQLEVGRAFVRAHLKATELGLAFHPMSQVLQEYSEMNATQQNLYRTLAIDQKTHTIQMLARVGFAQGAYPSPRRELDAIIKS
jgi:Nitroreductase family